MSEIEMMYDNAEVKKQIPDVCSSNELYCKECKAYIEDAIPYCKNAEYPPLTAEKQLSLIKFLFNHNVHYNVDDKGNYWFHITDDCYTYYYNKFEIALANIINEMWQDLTEEERAEIRSILNG